MNVSHLFSPLHSEFSPGCRIIDNFSDYFSFDVCDKEKDNKYRAHQLDKIVLESPSSSSIAIIASDASIKNNVTTLISHTHMYNKPITKTIHHAVHITSTESELFAIRCSINKHRILIMYPKLLSSLIPSMQLEKSSNRLSTFTKFS